MDIPQLNQESSDLNPQKVITPTSKDGKPTKIELKFEDGVGNLYTIKWPQSPNFFYRGLRPLQSCSGNYSGGPDAESNFESINQALQLEQLFDMVINDKNSESKQRLKGVKVIRNVAKGTSIIAKNGEKLFELEGKLEEIKNISKKVNESDFIVPKPFFSFKEDFMKNDSQ